MGGKETELDGIGHEQASKDSGALQLQMMDSEEKVLIAVSELDLLQSCQKIIDAAQSMKCISCQ
jgi:hypothetical protein